MCCEPKESAQLPKRFWGLIQGDGSASESWPVVLRARRIMIGSTRLRRGECTGNCGDCSVAAQRGSCEVPYRTSTERQCASTLTVRCCRFVARVSHLALDAIQGIRWIPQWDLVEGAEIANSDSGYTYHRMLVRVAVYQRRTASCMCVPRAGSLSSLIVRSVIKPLPNIFESPAYRAYANRYRLWE